MDTDEEVEPENKASLTTAVWLFEQKFIVKVDIIIRVTAHIIERVQPCKSCPTNNA